MKERTRAPAPLPAPSKANPPQRHLEHAGLTWLDVIEPTVTQLADLRERYAFDSLALEDVVSRIQRPKLDSFPQEEYLFTILHFPVLDKEQRVAFAGEVDLFIGRDYVITLHDGSLKPLRRLFTAAGSDEHARAQLMGRGSGYLLYRIVDALIKQCFPLTERIDDDLARIEARAFERDARRAVRELAAVRRDNVALRHILGPNLAVLRALETGDHPFLRLNQASYFGDLADGLATLSAILGEQQEIIAGLYATLDSLAVQRANEGIRLLIGIAAVLLPMIVIAGIFSMNLPWPFAQSTIAIPIILLVMLGATAGLVAYLRYKEWI
jgi:magnesium transporter